MNYSEIDPFDWMGSSLGNAYFSGVSMKQLWHAVEMSTNQLEFDAAIDAAVRLNTLLALNQSG